MTNLPGRWPDWHCPEHHELLRSSNGVLVCDRGHAFPLRDGIPRFTGSGYAAAFGLQWKEFAKTQLDSYSGTGISARRARRCLGEELWANLKNLLVLECGCGAGRFTEVLLSQGARVVSVDISEAVEANAANFPPDSRHRIAQADINALPFASAGFDLVFCLGVVQHTPSPEETLKSLTAQVRAGGSLVFDHYAHPWKWRTRSATLFRVIFKRLRPGRALLLLRRMARALLPIHKAASRSRFADIVLTRISPFTSYYRAHPELGDSAQHDWAILDTHDYLTDWFKHFRSRRQILATLVALGYQEIHCVDGGNGIEARARRAQ